jgi:hypothetical protein
VWTGWVECRWYTACCIRGEDYMRLAHSIMQARMWYQNNSDDSSQSASTFDLVCFTKGWDEREGIKSRDLYLCGKRLEVVGNFGMR